MCMYIYIYIYTLARNGVNLKHTGGELYTHTYLSMYVCIYPSCIYIYIYIYIFIYIYIYMVGCQAPVLIAALHGIA